MDDALLIHRIHFGFTAAYHYIFPQITMGLALLIVILKALALARKNEFYNKSARFWAKIFAISFAVGVVTGIPMEFQFGTNWARFSTFAGGVIGQTLAMEGMFAFFLESSFLGLFIFGEKKLGPTGHLFAAVMVFLGSWISGYFIVATNAWMQYPVAYKIASDGAVELTSYWGLLLNPWTLWQYLHTMVGSVVTASFLVAAVGAYYLLAGRDALYGKLFLRIGIAAGLVSSILMAFPTGDFQGKNIAEHQPATLAAMEGLFRTQDGAPLVIIGQPDMEKLRLDNPIHIPLMLSFLTYQRWEAEVKGLDAFPRENWPDNIPLLYYSYHIMVGLGTIFIALMALAARAALAPAPLRHTSGSLGADAGHALPHHRQHLRLDDRRAWTPAVAGLWDPAHSRRNLPHGLGGQRPLHAARVCRDVLRGGPPLPLFAGQGYQPRPGILRPQSVRLPWNSCGFRSSPS